MHYVKPRVFVIGESKINKEGLGDMLKEIGADEWGTDAISDAEALIEVAGKLCYMSFSTDLNKNLTRANTRNNEQYIQESLVSTKHGSVLEHTTVNFAFINVSRVLTHELVRHRVGAAYSQVSGRYVRNDDLGFYMPEAFSEDPILKGLFNEAIAYQEETIKSMAEHAGLGTIKGKGSFSIKKKLTSAFRRIVGSGVANHIIATYNHRAIRHLIEMRTCAGAEEEIRDAFGQVAEQMVQLYPAIYRDMSKELVDGFYGYTFGASKV